MTKEEFKELEFQRHAPMAADMAFIAVSIARIVQQVVESSERTKQEITVVSSAELAIAQHSAYTKS